MSFAFGFLGLLDLTILGLVYKICLTTSSDQRIMVDKETNRVYVITEAIPHSGRVVSAAITESFAEDDDLEDEKELRARLADFSLESLGEFGWDAMIVS